MNKLKYFWIVLSALLPITASKVNAQPFGAPIDLLAPIQEDIIHRMEQNGNSKEPPSVKYRSSYPMAFIKAIQRCDNQTIYNYIDVNRVVEDVRFYHPLLLKRARQCGAISSTRLQQILYYQRKYYNVDIPYKINDIRNLKPDGSNLVDPPRR